MKSSRLLVAGAIVALLPLAGAVAQTPTPDQGDQPTQPSQPSQDSQRGATFESLDKDSDGRISKSEAAVSANVMAQFTNYDKNGDGFIEREEVIAANSPPPADTTKQ